MTATCAESVSQRAAALGLDLGGRENAVLQRLKELEAGGFRFDGADGSFEMVVRRCAPDYRPAFELVDFTALVGKSGSGAPCAQVAVRVRVGDVELHTAADAEGPVHALDRAIRKALAPHYPALGDVRLVDYRVRSLDTHMGAAARSRVLIESARGNERWSTVGCSANIIEASWLALCDSLELPLLRDREARARRPHRAPARTGGVPPRHSFLHTWGS
jgi:2-isopropylmalate synthase